MTLLFETVTGSKAYRLGLPNSDTDVLRVLAHWKSNYLGLEEYTEARHVLGPNGEDTVEYDLRFFCKTLLNGSFNTLLTLHYGPNNYRFVSRDFEPFLKMNNSFFTKKAAASFHGFASRMFKQFCEKNDFKAAANGLFVLNAAVDLSKLGHLTFETSGFLLDVKRGYADKKFLEALYQDELNYYTPERLAQGNYVNDTDFVKGLLSDLCVKTLEE